jgi:hypothetical protein
MNDELFAVLGLVIGFVALDLIAAAPTIFNY